MQTFFVAYHSFSLLVSPDGDIAVCMLLHALKIDLDLLAVKGHGGIFRGSIDKWNTLFSLPVVSDS